MSAPGATGPSKTTRVSLVRTQQRAVGVAKALALLALNPVKSQDVLVKPNFNTADPFPGSTHNDTLEAVVREIQAMGATKVTIGDRSGPADTEEVIREKGVRDLAAKLGAEVLNFEDLSSEDWVRVRPLKSHWKDGFDVARPVLESRCVVATCCLKTHRYGGVFTMSLKLSVGITHRRNMGELHSSSRNMGKMIAEINQVYPPSLIVMDGIEAFTDGGPMRGQRKQAGVILAGTDRIAIDAVGLAVLKDLGSNREIMETGIFEQEQIATAVELGLGVAGPEDIEIVAEDTTSKEYAAHIMGILRAG